MPVSSRSVKSLKSLRGRTPGLRNLSSLIRKAGKISKINTSDEPAEGACSQM